MRFTQFARTVLVTGVAFASSHLAQAVTVQRPTDVLADGSAYLWVEAESASSLEGVDPKDSTSGFILVDKNNPIQTIAQDANGIDVVNGGLPVLPADTNASGGAAIFAQLPSGTTASWKLQFSIPATYYLYTHWSVFNRDTNTNYGNEDSFFVPPFFGGHPKDDWLGFEGTDVAGNPKTGDGINDGYIDGFPSFAQNYVDEGGVSTHNSTDENFYEGQFHWYWLSKANDMNADGAFVSFDGMAIKYEVTEADIGKELDFTIQYREPYGVIDGWLFSTNPDLLLDNTQEKVDSFFLNPLHNAPGDFNQDGLLNAADIDAITTALNAGNPAILFDVDGNGTANAADRQYLVSAILRTYLGDSNLDSEFNSADFVAVFSVGEYEDATEDNSTWADGDWNGDLDFNSGDFVAAFSEGGYEQGPKPSIAAVPEPALTGWLVIAMLAVGTRRKSH